LYFVGETEPKYTGKKEKFLWSKMARFLSGTPCCQLRKRRKAVLKRREHQAQKSKQQGGVSFGSDWKDPFEIFLKFEITIGHETTACPQVGISTYFLPIVSLNLFRSEHSGIEIP
jgi:hypothetical protein